MRVADQVRDRAADALGLAAHDGRLERRAEADRVASAALGALDELAHDLIDAHVVDDIARLGAAGQLDDVADERGQLVELRDDVGAQARALLLGQAIGVLEHLDVGAQARDRRPQLVARIGHEMTLRLGRALERVERRVEAAGQAGELVLALDLEALREVGVGGQRLRATREARDRGQRRARHDAAQHGRHEDADAADREQDPEQLSQGAIDLGQRPGDLHGAIRPASDREHAEVHAVDGGVAEVPSEARRGERLRPRVDRQSCRRRRRARRDDRSGPARRTAPCPPRRRTGWAVARCCDRRVRAGARAALGRPA